MNRVLRKHYITLLSFISLIFLIGCMSTSSPTHYQSSYRAQSLPEKGEYLAFRIPSGAGGGLDKLTRFIIGVIERGSYYDQPVIPVNTVCGGMSLALQMLNGRDDENTVLIGSNSVITTPMFLNLPFSYHDLTPIGILYQLDFILWVRADSPWMSAREFIADARKRSIKVGGTGSKHEDEIVFRMMEDAGNALPFEYIPMRGGKETARALADGKIEATVNQVNEIIQYYPEKVKPLCVFREENLELPDGKVVPSCRDAGIDVTYNDFIAIFAPSGISAEHKGKLVRLFEDVSKDESWIAYARYMGLRPYFLSGNDMDAYLADMEIQLINLFTEQGWIRRRSTNVE